ncbi:M15 family metallopeptidase [Acetobacterium woodii]|uniref:D-alanyl-D-alanine dipeptidase n=1 Tax=Acetobacterium woodii (strain ATCC 29683 / DSM 1030 / JCM 2381 / KCTC 1655 / WB1) TaxID=931626 RepID=H6LBY3_ACEWD|nr:M15 family metallopeptidase [Acetobacterium woodii]AFA47726.1 D-alanyl-D-alanine dipeptidase PdgL [Acetobacterium woodii DSM 1030]
MKKIMLVRPKDFVDISLEIPGIITDVKYFTGDNFVGEKIDGYEKPAILLTEKAAIALERVQRQLMEEGCGLKVFDGYRPKRAVAHFIRWGKQEENGKTKSIYYPDMTRREIFENGFIAPESSHTRGSTVDLTVVKLETGTEIDMGGSFDFFSEVSYSDYDHLTLDQSKNRVQLRYLMRSEGFEPLQQEWWHFTLSNEPYPEIYFDFPIQD